MQEKQSGRVRTYLVWNERFAVLLWLDFTTYIFLTSEYIWVYYFLKAVKFLFKKEGSGKIEKTELRYGSKMAILHADSLLCQE